MNFYHTTQSENFVPNQNANFSPELTKPETIAFPTLEGYEFVLAKDIIYFKGENNYSTLYLTNNRKILVSKCLKNIGERLTKYSFFRIHKSTIVSLSHVRKYLRGTGGQLVMSCGAILDVSKGRKNGFLNNFL